MSDVGAAPELSRRLAEGMRRSVLSFPLTPFDEDGSFAPKAFEAHLEHQLAAAPGAVFVGCGTGEFFSLGLDEYETAVAAAVRRVSGAVPVIAGAGNGAPLAIEYARAARRAGADALLLLPPYLISGTQAGLVQHTRAVAEAAGLPLVVYQRAQAVYEPGTLARIAEIPGVIGFKDGIGDLDRMQRLVRAVPEDFLFFNGTPTAELQARSYAAIGVPAYSSAVHAFAPEIARAFFHALAEGDTGLTDALLDDFFIPWVQLRDRGPGYSVSLVKEVARTRSAVIGADVGPVRAPLSAPEPAHLEEAERLLQTGLELADRTTAKESR
ncbi:5-dehydro-4-deoxyglucarate dehydratase [Nocardiopsis halotolerans]|uniref:5-dehydro-4-deoxyglucarate dehydratase n=1 Tax=Nocardiopsis halotolerans TaxID=124252 RepID=UPI000349414C|nr:5-dehydro-4-deoxyglucarate dehydratase [Nocardiopsis halotolerans]